MVPVPSQSSKQPSEAGISKATSFYGKAPSDDSSNDCYTSCEEDVEVQERFIPSKISSLQEVNRISNRIGTIDKSIDRLMGMIDKKSDPMSYA